jgi:hypothetical protein
MSSVGYESGLAKQLAGKVILGGDPGYANATK